MIKYLYDELGKRWYAKGGSVWMFSDPHFNDPESKSFRGDSYPGDDEVVKRINSKVSKNDTIVFLGDIGDLEFIKKIKGYKVLIMGNHDKGASNYKRDKVLVPTPKELLEASNGLLAPEAYVDNHLFDEVYEGPLMINDRVILSHEPLFPIRQYEFNIHGHVHNPHYEGDLQHKNICAEALDYYPINLGNLLKHGLLKDIPTIHRLTIDCANRKKGKK